MRLSARSQVPTAKARNNVRALIKTAAVRSGNAPVALVKSARLINKTMDTFTRTYNGVGSPEAARLRAGYVKPNNRSGIPTRPLDTRHTIEGDKSQNMSSGGSIA